MFKTPPVQTPSDVSVDGPLLGNGFIAAAMAGPPDSQTYFLARNDFWRLTSAYNESFPAVLGKLQILVPSLKGASYRVEQKLYEAVTVADFKKGSASLRITSLVAATKDWLVIALTNTGTQRLNVQTVLRLPGDDQFHIDPPTVNKFADTVATGSGDGLQWIERGFVRGVDIPTMAAAAIKTPGELSIPPGKTDTLVCALASNFSAKDCLARVLGDVRNMHPEAIRKALREHADWWSRYWNESFVSIGDSLIEALYYTSQYNMASCSRDPKFPPGIFGSWITREIPAWNGDYHLNYNYSAPFYALYASNHLQQARPYETPLTDFLLRGKYYSKKITGIDGGALYPVGIGPLGIETTREDTILDKHDSEYVSGGQVEDEGLFFGQKSDAAYCVTDLSMQFYHTYDVAFTRRVYPFVRSVAVFWQHYLQKEGDRYVILNDAIHEGTIGTKNPILSLGLVPMVLKTAMDMSVLLGVDEHLRGDWQGKMDSLSAYPVQQRHGKTVFRYTDSGVDWWDGNTLGIQHIYPAGGIGLSSDPHLLEIARNTIDEMQRWMDVNGSNSFFPAAVRVGYNADTVLKRLHEYCLHTHPNGFQLHNPHGIENCSTVPNTIDEMLCMSNQHILRVFADWPMNRDASFSTLRSEGAFLVSSALKNGTVQYVKIVSEKGRTCVLQNPWPGRFLVVKSNKGRMERKSGEVISLPTLPGEVLMIKGEDVPSLDELASDWMDVPTLRNFPSVMNFAGGLQTTENLTGFQNLTFPPYAEGGGMPYSWGEGFSPDPKGRGECTLRINGQPVNATGSRWLPYEVQRKTVVDSVGMQSFLRLPFEQMGVLQKLILDNRSSGRRSLVISLHCHGRVRRYANEEWRTWGNTRPDETEPLSGAVTRFAFSTRPSEIHQGEVTWNVVLAPGEKKIIEWVCAVGNDTGKVSSLADKWASSFGHQFDAAKIQWEQRWQGSFTPGNRFFSGHFPVLVTSDPKIRRVYYMGALTPLLLCRTTLPLNRRCFVTAGPRWANTLMYFWDTEMWANTWAMLDPETMKAHLEKWLSTDIHHCYAVDCMSGGGAGPWYAANDWSVFRCVEAYIGVTGDSAFLHRRIGDKTVLEHLDSIATFYESRPLKKGDALADYGGPENLLECSPSYIEGVASLNAADVYMLRRTAHYYKISGNGVRAADLMAKAGRLLPAVLSLYDAGQGVWDALDSAGHKVPVRHCYDYIVTGQALENDLSSQTKTEMNRFVSTELRTRTWMRAMSLKDPAAAKSDRPDHGPMGSYDAWPPETMDVMCRFGDFDDAVAFLRATEAMTHQGPWAQAHEFLGPDSRGSDPVVRVASRGGQDANEGCGGSFAEVVIRSFFGFRADLSGDKPVLLDPGVPRGFEGVLKHVSWKKKMYTIVSDAKGLHIIGE
ncbi:glycosyl hydrolase family 95 catalytic domain-containing protein [Dinghuibacter silviterrae]|uniref:glycosyl hydrolase family 95 catalytic domain-containing protein n=1 Tax=Dinghuibacter silviterrae TaxID=1539049 RepID=UPI001063C594|nr:hypothetical protein [Dinghuibacter silviterrae]